MEDGNAEYVGVKASPEDEEKNIAKPGCMSFIFATYRQQRLVAFDITLPYVPDWIFFGAVAEKNERRIPYWRLTFRLLLQKVRRRRIIVGSDTVGNIFVKCQKMLKKCESAIELL